MKAAEPLDGVLAADVGRLSEAGDDVDFEGAPPLERLLREAERRADARVGAYEKDVSLSLGRSPFEADAASALMQIARVARGATPSGIGTWNLPPKRHVEPTAALLIASDFFQTTRTTTSKVDSVARDTV